MEVKEIGDFPGNWPGFSRQHHTEELCPLSTWITLAQVINEKTKKTPKAGWDLHSKLLFSWVQLREKLSFRAKHKLQDIFITNFPNFLLEGQGGQKDLLWFSLTTSPLLQILYKVIFHLAKLFSTLSTDKYFCLQSETLSYQAVTKLIISTQSCCVNIPWLPFLFLLLN